MKHHIRGITIFLIVVSYACLKAEIIVDNETTLDLKISFKDESTGVAVERPIPSNKRDKVPLPSALYSVTLEREAPWLLGRLVQGNETVAEYAKKVGWQEPRVLRDALVGTEIIARADAQGQRLSWRLENRERKRIVLVIREHTESINRQRPVDVFIEDVPLQEQEIERNIKEIDRKLEYARRHQQEYGQAVIDNKSSYNFTVQFSSVELGRSIPTVVASKTREYVDLKVGNYSAAISEEFGWATALYRLAKREQKQFVSEEGLNIGKQAPITASINTGSKFLITIQDAPNGNFQVIAEPRALTYQEREQLRDQGEAERNRLTLRRRSLQTSLEQLRAERGRERAH